MTIELKIKTDVYTNTKVPKLIKKDLIHRVLLDTRDIIHVKECIDSKGGISSNECVVFLKDLGEVRVNHSYEFLKGLKEEKVIGFRLETTQENPENQKINSNKNGKQRKTGNKRGQH